jgi:acetyl esterase/lipase
MFLVALSALGVPPQEYPLWSGVAPGSEGQSGEEKWVERGTDGVVNRAVSNVHRPALIAYLPDQPSAHGTSLLLFPGGSFRHLSIDNEGHDVARALCSRGIAAFIVKYRLPRTEGNIYTMNTAVSDALQAMKLVRSRAAEWGLNGDRVGMMGFSAGGDLAVLAAARAAKAERPAFLGLIYSGRPADLGPLPDDFPPAFILTAGDDRSHAEPLVKLYQDLFAKKISAELHVYSRGGHAFGMKKLGLPVSEWLHRLTDWLEAEKLLAATPAPAAPKASN